MNSPSEIAKAYINIGENKAKTPFFKLVILSILAGMFIAIAGAGATVASCTISNPSVAKIIAGCVFPAGLAMVILAGSELFTGDCLMIISVLEKRISVLKMLKTWLIVYIGNLIGGLLVSAMVVWGHTLSMFDGALLESVVKTATAKANIGFTDGLIRGIMCNILVCLAVWMAASAKTSAGKIVALFLPIMIFVACGFEHSIANMFYIPVGLFATYEYGITADGLNWFGFLVQNEIPVTIGNIIGGVSVGGMYWLAYLKK